MAPDLCAPEAALERDELARLLDRALGFLPADTRAMLVAHHLEETPQAALAARLRVSEGAVKVRLHRGRRALWQVLATTLRDEAAAYGPVGGATDGWRETRIWCPECGARRLVGDFDPVAGRLLLRCPGCYLAGPEGFNSRCTDPALFAGVSGYKPAFGRVLAAGAAYFGAALSRRDAPCLRCGRAAALRYGRPDSVATWRRTPFALHVACPYCGATTDFCLRGLARATPQARQFWRRYPRLRTLPLRAVEHTGRSALVVTLAAVGGAATLDVIVARDTFQLLSVGGVPSTDVPDAAPHHRARS